ncbi:HofO [Enterobacter cloacae]|nr:HofO [Enterobacter cloacae]
MNMILERWCESRRRYRVLCGGLGVAFLWGTAWGVFLRPLNSQLAALQMQMAEAVQRHAALWRVASNGPRRTPESDVRPVVRFSPLDFQADGATLVHWKPLPGGGELALDADWPAILTVFTRLAQRDVRIAAFTLVPQGAALRLRVQLEQDHAK